MQKYTATVTVEIPLVIEAATKEEAQKIFEEQLSEIAGSNDGHELLANATPVVTTCDASVCAFPY